MKRSNTTTPQGVQLGRPAIAFVGTVMDTSAASNIKNTLSTGFSPTYSNIVQLGDIFNPGPITNIDATYTVTFPLGTKRGYVVINSFEGSLAYTVCIPFIVEGFLNNQVPILGTYTQPQLPFTVLHPPPGNGSFTQLNTSKRLCRSLENAFTSAQDINAKANVKIGAKFSVGFIVTTEVEVYAQLNFAAGGGFSKLETNSKETCLTSNNTFAAGVQAGVSRDSSDRFIGYGYDVEWGVYDTIGVIGGNVKHYKGVVGVPLTPTAFSKTIVDIRSDIASLTNLVNAPTSTIKQKADAQNQIAVWNQVLALNETNKANASAPYPGAISGFTGGSPLPTFTSTESSQVTTTQSITAETYFSTTVGVEFALNIGGSGFGASSEFTSKFNWGSTNAISQSTGNDLTYSLWDQDNSGPPYDQLNFQTFRDPMFGTPVFKLSASSRTSCPYEGGYRREQLRMKIVGQTDPNQTVNVSSTDINASADFMIELYNESDEPRSYTLGINNASNLSGARISASGFPLNGTPQPFPIPAGGCLGCDPNNRLIVSIKRENINSPLSFPNRELVFYSACDGAISSSIFLTANFGVDPETQIAAKIFLEGAYNTTTHRMNANLRSGGFIPQNQPFTAMANVNFTHQGGGGSESTTPLVLGVVGSNAIVDWVFLELRDPSVPTTVLRTRSALLQVDGDVVDVDGVSPVRFVGAPAGNYFIAIKHRNHLRMRTLNAVTLTSGINTFNFSNNSIPLIGTNALRLVEAGVYALFTGDLNGDGAIDAADRSTVWNFRNLTGYSIYDSNLNGTVDATDRSNAWNNRNLNAPF
ncbi:MAG: hypothetical protein HC817_09915 [Saprospiraceae bacterium]|nr:hypothetical protein [Saprospiraceae bacterium]